MNRSLAVATVASSSAVVLVLEIAVIRLVAPFAGDTLETYTAAIGVALAAIAVGAKLGGDAADRWTGDTTPPDTAPRDGGRSAAWLLGSLLVLGGGTTLLARPVVLLAGPFLSGLGPVTALLLVALGIALPAALLSAVTPVVIKTQLHDLHRTGRVVGLFSAWSTVGALAGTFVTGFVLLAVFPVSVVLLVSGLAMAALGAAFLLRRAGGGLTGLLARGAALLSGQREPRATPDGPALFRWPRMLGAVVLGAVLLPLVPSPCDTESAYYCARVVEDPERASGRVLYLDDLRHGYVDLDDPEHLEFGYTQWLAAAIDTAAPDGEPLAALHVGGGAYTMPGWLAATRPGSASTVLEIDPTVTALARDRLALDEVPDVTVRSGDARTAIAAEPTGAFDVVVGDAFGGLSVPWHLTTRELVREVRRTLTPNGFYVLNIIDYRPRRFLQAEVATLATEFDHVQVLQRAGADTGGNHVVVAADHAVDPGSLRAAAGATADPAEIVPAAEVTRWERDGVRLTDDYAPVDQLITPYIT